MASRVSRVRCAPALFVAIAVGAIAPWIVDCATGEEELFGNGGTGSGTNYGVRLTYDEPSGRLRVHVRGPATEGLQVFARVRRGNLSETSLTELDCEQLSASPRSVVDMSRTVDGAASASTAGSAQTGTRDLVTHQRRAASPPAERTYVGPQVDKDLLGEFYDANTIVNDPTPNQAAEIRAGVNPVAEACLLLNGKEVARFQRNALTVWDDATPNLVDQLVALEEGQATSAPKVRSVSTYFAACERLMGQAPFFSINADGTRGTYDCIEGEFAVRVPITVSDGSGNEVPVTQTPARCDRPDWLRSTCKTDAYINRAINSKGSHWVLLCREAGDKDGQKVWNDVAMIGHDPKSGFTCFVQNALFAKTNARRVPSPADPVNAYNMWASFNGEACNSCHDSDPFITSPWSDMAQYEDGTYVVPRMGSDPDFPLGTTAPYRIVGAKANGWTLRRHVTSPQAAACTACHRIAEGATLFGETLDSPTHSFTARSVGADRDFFSSVTTAFQQYQRSHWMPPDPKPTEAQWAASEVGKAAQFLLDCARQGTCQFSPLP